MHPRKRKLVATGTLICALALNVSSVLASTYTFQGLGDLTGGSFLSYARAVSADGSVVVGGSSSDSGTEAYRWTAGGGMVGLGFLNSAATPISFAFGVSADGSVVAGGSFLNNLSSETEVFRWTSGGGMVGLGDLPGGSFDSDAQAVSSDGLVVVGVGNSASGFEAFRWTSGGMVGLGDLSGGSFNSGASGVSADGSVVVGIGSSAFGDEAFRWTSAGGIVGLGHLPGGSGSSDARAISADGSVVVGQSVTASGDEAFLWTAGKGMQNLRDVLIEGGATGLSDWTLPRATGISADGKTIVGFGINSNGDQEAWIATIPEPSTFALAACGLLAYVGACWTRRKSGTVGELPYATRCRKLFMHPRKLNLFATGMMVCGLCSHPMFALCASYTFQGLGDLPGAPNNSSTWGVSADGSVVVGMGNRVWTFFDDIYDGEAFRWTVADGTVGLGDLPGGDFNSNAVGASLDGSVVVGWGSTPAGLEAYRWTSTDGMVGLGYLPGGNSLSVATRVSADGSVVVGASDSASGIETFRWTSAGGMVGLGNLGGQSVSNANDVSADGSVIVGQGISGAGQEAFRWTSAGGMVGLGDLPDGDFGSRAYGVSADGSVVVGQANSVGGGFEGGEAFRWTSDDGMIGLGQIPGGTFGSIAFDVSSDGSVVVGSSDQGLGDVRAALWTTADGMQNLRDLLIAGGATGLADWILFAANGVSDDGRTIVGTGMNPNGDVEAWIATVPEPSTFALAACGFVALFALRWRQRRRLAFV